jgi:inosose dehydratase
MPGPRLAVNPIAYWLATGTPDRSTATLGAAFAELADIGYRAVKADVPTDMRPEDYLTWLAGFGLAPSVGLFNGSFDDPKTHRETAEQARRFAAVQARFGLTVCMISTIEPAGSARRRHPAIGADHRAERLAMVIDGVAAACEAMHAEGVRGALHSHVGGWIETESEVRTVLDAIGPGLLGFGPDTGHLAWAGADVPALLAHYAERLVAVHLKDVFAEGVRRAVADDLDYHEATLPGRLWAEPGSGQVDLPGCLAAFPADYTGDYMIEIDVPSVPTRRAHEIAYGWAREHLPLMV